MTVILVYELVANIHATGTPIAIKVSENLKHSKNADGRVQPSFNYMVREVFG